MIKIKSRINSLKIDSLCQRVIEVGFYLLFFATPLFFTPLNFELFEIMQHQKNDIETILITKKDHIEGASSILGLIVSKSLTKILETYILGPQ